MSANELEEMGPIDYLIIEWPDRQPSGEAAPLLADLVDRGLIRIIDLAFIAKGEDGSVTMLDSPRWPMSPTRSESWPAPPPGC